MTSLLMHYDGEGRTVRDQLGEKGVMRWII